MKPLLEVRDLRTAFHTERGRIDAVRGVSFALAAGETLGLVGESGCGKSVTAMSITRLLREPPAEIQAGSSVRFREEELLQASPARLREVRGAGIGMIFQEPMTSLNPVLRIGDQVAEAIRDRVDGDGRRAGGRSGAPGRGARDRGGPRDRVIELLGRVGIPEPEERYRAFPHQLSGGMRQRVMIAIALAGGPDLLIADEPTTALDVTIQAQILDLLADLQAELGMALLLISHDLAVVARVAKRVAVMYAGRIVEEGVVPDIFRAPAHPYTQGLLRALPRLDTPAGPLETIPGRVPGPHEKFGGCPFAPRCPEVMPRCRAEDPPAFPTRGGHARCWLREPGFREADG